MMKRFSLFIMALILCASCSSCAVRLFFRPGDGPDELPAEISDAPSEPEGVPDIRNYIACTYYDEALVRAQTAAAEPSNDYQNIAGAVVPHYAPAMYMVSDILASVSSAPETVVIVAPNHAGKGAPVQISGSGYYWKSGTLAGDQELASRLTGTLRLDADDSAAREDWSASLLVPYIAHYFPDTRVVTVLLSRGAGGTQIQSLAKALAEAAKTQSLLVLGSADFSHYQDERTARACDEETARVIASGDVSRLLTLGNEYLDSPETVGVLLTYASLTERESSEADGLFETFIQDGRRMAGSYYAYVLK